MKKKIFYIGMCTLSLMAALTLFNYAPELGRAFHTAKWPYEFLSGICVLVATVYSVLFGDTIGKKKAKV